ncbi:MAG: DUF2752 domain-containing protein [Flavobacteriales bacterium]
MFVYSGFFIDESFAVQCVYKELLGRECVSCGLTRDFHSYLSLDFSSPLNPYSLSIFLFFFVQMWFRLILALLDQRIEMVRKKVATVDVVLTVLAFLFCFGGLIAAQYS